MKKTQVPTKKRDGMAVWGCEAGLREVKLGFGRDLQILRQVYHGQFPNPEFLRPRAGCACHPEEKGHSTELATLLCDPRQGLPCPSSSVFIGRKGLDVIFQDFS